MKKIVHHEKDIAEEWQFLDKHQDSVSRLAVYKAASYHLSCKRNLSFGSCKKEIEQIINDTLFNFKNPTLILESLGGLKGLFHN